MICWHCLLGLTVSFSKTFSFMHLLNPKALLWHLSNHIWAKKRHIFNKKEKHGRWEHCHCLIVLLVVLGYIIFSFLWSWCVSVPPNVRKGDGVAMRGHRGQIQRGNQSSFSLFVWFNITLVYPWMDAKTFEFKAKERAMEVQGFSEDWWDGGAWLLRNMHVHTNMHLNIPVKWNEGNYKAKSMTNKYVLGQNSRKNQTDFRNN